jgi:1,4-alpha-glucan branching enzyme
MANVLSVLILLIDFERIFFVLLDEYEWKYDASPLPPDEELVIYEIHVGDFSGGIDDPNARGTFTNVLKKIDYLKELGVNAGKSLILFK